MKQLEMFNSEPADEAAADKGTEVEVPTSSHSSVNTNVGRGAVYVLATNWGQFLESVVQSGGALIFSYTNRIFDGYLMNKKEADYYCSIKPFFKQMKIAQ